MPMLLIYNILNILLLPFWALYLLYRAFKGKEQLSRLQERFGIASISAPKNKNLIWIHVASVGEAMSILTLIDKLKTNLPSYKVLLTSGTVASDRIIKDKLKDIVIHQYLPLDNYLCINLFLNYWRPKLVLFVESEFWPSIISESAKRSKVISVNTRISPKSCQNWQRYPAFIRPITDSISLFMAQSLNDMERLKLIEARNTLYLGNLKYCTNNKIIDDKLLLKLKTLFKGRKILLAASTHEGEDKLIAETYCHLKKQNKNLLLIIAPRHPIRSKKIKQMLEDELDLKVSTRSIGGKVTNDIDVYLADTIGELNYLYSISPISIVGGSFVQIGGHNIIEPAKLGSAIIVGPYHFNFQEICDEFADKNAAQFVQNKEECIKAVEKLLENPKQLKLYTDNAAKIVATKNTTLDKVLKKILTFI